MVDVSAISDEFLTIFWGGWIKSEIRNPQMRGSFLGDGWMSCWDFFLGGDG
jgi:hypothetical protein